MERKLTIEKILEFKEYLVLEEKSAATVEQYHRDVRAFFVFSQKREITK